MGTHARLLALAAIIVIFAPFAPRLGLAETTPSFLAPPRTIADITAILDQEKPDPGSISKMQAEADAQPPRNADVGALVEFYYKRAVARSNLGRFRDAIADSKTGIALGLRERIDVTSLRQLLGYQYDWSGDIKDALEVFLALARDSDLPQKRGYLFNAYRWISFLLIRLGDLDQAERYREHNESLLSEDQNWREYTQQRSC